MVVSPTTHSRPKSGNECEIDLVGRAPRPRGQGPQAVEVIGTGGWLGHGRTLKKLLKGPS